MKRFSKFLAVVLALAMTFGLTTSAFAADPIELEDDVLAKPRTENSVAKVGDDYFDTLAEAVEAAAEGDTVVIIKDMDLDASVAVAKKLTITTDGLADYTITGSTFTSDWLLNIKTQCTVGGASETSRLIIDGQNLSHSKGTFVVQNKAAAGSTVRYLTVKNTVNANGSYGGGAYSNTTVTYEHCEFINNSSTNADKGNGGGFYSTKDGVLTFTDCLFEGNTSARHGGAFYGATNAKATFTNCTFKDNTCAASRMGGATYVNGGESAFSFENCQFTNNVISGSADTANTLYSAGEAYLTLKDCTFTDQTKAAAIKGAYTDGGGNSFLKVQIDAPTLKAASAQETGSAFAWTDIFNGFDADKMTAAITAPAETAEVKEPGTYTITVTAGDDYKFADEAVTTFTFEVTAAVAYVAQVGETQYTTIGEAIEAAEVGGVVMLLENIDTAVIGKRVEFQGEKTIANATVAAAALPLDLTHVTFTNTTFAADVTANTTVFEHQWEGKFGTLTNAGMTVVEGGFYTYFDYVATIGANRYQTLPEAVEAASAGDTVVLCADVTLDAALKITKAITITTDGNGDRTIFFDPAFSAATWAIDLGSAYIEFKGASAESRIVLDGRNNERGRGLLYVHTGNGALVQYVTVQNSINTTTGNNGAAAIYVSTGNADVETVLDNVTVKDCTSAGNGAIALASLNLKVQNSTFQNNTVAGNGGAINSTTSTATHNKSVINCTFTGNKAADGQDIKSAADNLTVTGCTFDHTRADAISGAITDGGSNTFLKVQIDAPTLKAASAQENGSAFAWTDIFNGFDADKMTAAITAPAETAEVKEPGTYTITVTAGDDYKFADEAVTTFTFEVTAAVAYVAQVGETQYTTIGEAIEAAEVGGVVMLLEDIDTAVIGKRVEFQGEKTIANATVSAAALPLDLTHVTFTNTTFAADVTANTTVFEHQWEGKFGTLTNAGMTVAEGGFYTYSEYEATIGANRYATLPEAVAASVAGDTVVLCKDIALSAALIIKKSITIATGADHDLTIDASAVATAFAVQANPDAASDIIVKFIGSADSRLIIDAKGASNSKSTVLSQRCDTEFEYVTIKNSNSSYKGGGLYVTTGKAKLTNCVLDSNKTSSSDGGGALYMTASGVVEMTRCTLSNNENTAGPGGAVQSASNSSFTATNCSFENNKASGKGGVIRLNGAMQLTGCTFAGNSSSDADISEANSADVVRSIAGSTFDKTEAEAIARNASGHIVLSTENPNTFVIDVVEIAVPTAKNAAYTSLDIAFEQLFEGYDAEKMTCAGPATVKEIGSYTYTFTAKEGFAFPGNQTTAEVVAKVTAPDDGTASGGTGEVDITMGAKVGDTITAAFYVDIKDTVPADKYDSVIMRVQLGDGSTVDLTGTENADGQLEYDFENIFSQHMTEKLSGSVIGIKSEVETVLGDFEGISIAEYCDKLAAAYPDNEKLLGFLANMLRYGAECQKYAEFRVDNLADAGHAWMDGKVQTADPVATVAKDEISRFAEGADKANGSIKGAGLNIMNKIAIYFLVSLPESADASAAVLTVNGTDYALSAKSGDDYVVVADRINPSEYGKVFKAELKLDGTAVAHTVNYSVNTYCADMFGGDGTAIQNLVKAIYNYGVAAAAYAE